jgi:hypothetical protein
MMGAHLGGRRREEPGIRRSTRRVGELAGSVWSGGAGLCVGRRGTGAGGEAWAATSALLGAGASPGWPAVASSDSVAGWAPMGSAWAAAGPAEGGWVGPSSSAQLDRIGFSFFF